jgi:hypothetical protein
MPSRPKEHLQRQEEDSEKSLLKPRHWAKLQKMDVENLRIALSLLMIGVEGVREDNLCDIREKLRRLIVQKESGNKVVWLADHRRPRTIQPNESQGKEAEVIPLFAKPKKLKKIPVGGRAKNEDKEHNLKLVQ